MNSHSTDRRSFVPRKRHLVDSLSVENTYKRLAPIYDVIYGALLQHGRTCAMSRLAPRPGETILEVGVGTGLSALQYPPGCRVVAIDLSAPMLERARTRLRHRGIDHVKLCRMDAAALAFPDMQFDAIYAPYVLNVVPDPVRVAREMVRVHRPGGRLVLLNHFDHISVNGRALDRFVGRLAVCVSGVNWHLDFRTFLRDAGLTAVSVEQVNVPPVSSVVVCRGR
jgi:phosphatidylethanolamine/phosphatidyl-N-methylethanolamine N-methyltransferase